MTLAQSSWNISDILTINFLLCASDFITRWCLSIYLSIYLSVYLSTHGSAAGRVNAMAEMPVSLIAWTWSLIIISNDDATNTTFFSLCLIFTAANSSAWLIKGLFCTLATTSFLFPIFSRKIEGDCAHRVGHFRSPSEKAKLVIYFLTSNSGRVLSMADEYS